MELLISVSRLRLDRKSKQSPAFTYVIFFVGKTLHKGSAQHNLSRTFYDFYFSKLFRMLNTAKN